MEFLYLFQWDFETSQLDSHVGINFVSYPTGTCIGAFTDGGGCAGVFVGSNGCVCRAGNFMYNGRRISEPTALTFRNLPSISVIC